MPRLAAHLTHLGLGEMASVYDTRDADGFVEKAPDVVALGYDAVKVVSIPYAHYAPQAGAAAAAGETLARLREAVGEGVDIMVDFHGRPASAAVARDFTRALAPARPLFVEELVPPEDMDGLARLTADGIRPVAAGERLIGRRNFAEALRRRAFDIAQPDI